MLNSKFKIKDLSATNKILGMETSGDRHSRKLFLILERFEIEDSKSISTPLAAHFRLSTLESPQTEDKERYMSLVHYSSALESLIYAMVCTRPDISHGYLKRTSNTCLEFKICSEGLVDYVDSDYARDLDKRRSLISYLSTFNNCTISWKATLQVTVALPTTKAKYMTIIEAMKEVIWLRGLFGELVERFICDNQSVIHLIKDQMHHKRTKHIDI
ncbi:Retrovirus-related Pol polyprotein from transposon TNT 1-94 [Gossypium australe]|uniref:Retrovirus-related Pol polyprotein from transposon TNT 1-94 n=1 Tax=Gossypium australe TaxID=47621 RepID=A0A5B6UIT0_9ROSI|nr:Retrovirus-related Pol polyprotein from transposon TNT 1-94 [Gossypium australe]